MDSCIPQVLALRQVSVKYCIGIRVCEEVLSPSALRMQKFIRQSSSAVSVFLLDCVPLKHIHRARGPSRLTRAMASPETMRRNLNILSPGHPMTLE